MRCYFDGSEGAEDNGTKWLTLAGFMAPDGLWGAFQRKWEAMLRDRYPIAPYVHMCDLLSHNDPFERSAGWSETTQSSWPASDVGVHQ